MRDAHDVVAALEERQHALNESAQRLTESQRALDATFDQRGQSLEQLVAMLEDKRLEFEQSMSGFVNSLTQSLHTVGTRAHDISDVLAQTSDQTAHVIEERFALVREAAENERAHTSQSLQHAFAEATDEMNRLFADAQKKFHAATGEIRGLAREIHQEIETTREEVRRSAAELPREAAEQSAALRRVVGEQVKSLNELTEMMSRSGRALEQGDAAVSRRISSDTPPLPPRVEQPRTRTTPPALPQRAKPEPQGGWLSDLLERASRDDKSPRAQHAPGNALDRLTLDIARMVDDAAVADVWRRYQRGEKGGLFGRRLYTLQGRQTFEEISRRYRVDADFRATVDQYIRNFEDLVVETTRNDRDGSRTLTLLTADTGKVYTMLGHAAGRFE